MIAGQVQDGVSAGGGDPRRDGDQFEPDRAGAGLANIRARLSFSAGTYTLHLLANSRREQRFLAMFDAVQAPPKAG